MVDGGGKVYIVFDDGLCAGWRDGHLIEPGINLSAITPIRRRSMMVSLFSALQRFAPAPQPDFRPDPLCLDKFWSKIT